MKLEAVLLDASTRSQRSPNIVSLPIRTLVRTEGNTIVVSRQSNVIVRSRFITVAHHQGVLSLEHARITTSPNLVSWLPWSEFPSLVSTTGNDIVFHTPHCVHDGVHDAAAAGMVCAVCGINQKVLRPYAFQTSFSGRKVHHIIDE